MDKIFIGSVLLFVCLYTQLSYSDDLMINDPWVREAPPAARVLAGYFDLINHGNEGKILVSVTSKDFDDVEIHMSKMENGMMMMEKKNDVKIDKGETVIFKPGGLHLMLLNPKRKLISGDKVNIVLAFKDGKTLPVDFLVKKRNIKHNMDSHDY